MPQPGSLFQTDTINGYFYITSIVVNNVRAAANHVVVAVAYKNKVAGLSENYCGQRLFKGKNVDYQDKWKALRD